MPLKKITKEDQATIGREALFKFTEETTNDVKVRRAKVYYSEKYAKDAKALLDRLHLHGTPLHIPCGEYSPTTLALQYYHGAEYLRDHDESGKYESLFRATKCTKGNDYLLFQVRKVVRGLASLASVSNPWKEQFLTFIDNATEGQKMIRTDVVLSDDDVLWFYNQLAPLEKLFIGRATNREILVIRHTET